MKANLTGKSSPIPHFFRCTRPWGYFNIIVVQMLVQLSAFGQKQVFYEDFSSPSNSTYTVANGGIGSSTWNMNRSGGDFGARITGGKLELTNNASASSNINGHIFAYKDATTAVGAPYNPILGNNQGIVTWQINLQQDQTDLTGFSTAIPYGTGLAYVLASTSTTPATSGNGYALVIGRSSGSDRPLIVRFTGGIQNSTIITTDGPACSGNCVVEVGTEVATLRIRFFPRDNRWTVGATLANGFFIPARSGGDNTYTGSSLPYFGMFWQAAGGTSKACSNSEVAISISPYEPDYAPLSYNQSFGTSAFSAYPSAIEGWAGFSGATVNSQAQAEATVPSINCPLNAQSGAFAGVPSGGLYGFSSSSNGRIAIGSSADANQGVNQPVVGIKADPAVPYFLINYDLEVLYSGDKPTGNTLLYQNDIGTTITPWASVPGSSSNYGPSPTLGDKRTATCMLSTDPANVNYFTFRWATWRDGAIGTQSSTLGLDNVRFTALISGAATTLTTSPPSSGNYNPGATNVILQRVDLTQNAAATAATLSSLTVTTTGFYSATDLINIKVWYSADATLTGADPTLSTITSGLGVGQHLMTPFTSQLLPAGTTGYLFITADLSPTAAGGRFVQLDNLKFEDIGISGASELGISPLSIANPQLIFTTPTIASPPTATSLLATSATMNGNILDNGGTTVTKRGFFYSLTNGFANGTGTEVSSTGSYGAGTYSQGATGLTPNTTYYFKSFAINSLGTVYSTQGSFTTPKPEPTNTPTVFACGTTGLVSIPLTWADATGAVLPDGYLIRWSTVSYAAISSPTDGTPVGDDSFNQNVAQGVQSVTINNLTYNQTYYFKIFSYTNSGTNINYRTATFGQTTCGTQSGQTETFETGTKGAYATADVTCALGSWNMNEALIGNTASDVKNGSQCVRMRNSGGYLTMNFDIPNGVSTVSIKHAKYGADANSFWQLEYSLNGGSTWVLQGGTVTTSGTTLATQSYTVNQPGAIRFRIAKLTNNNRVNLDDILFVPFCSAPAPTSSISFSSITSTGLNTAWGSGTSTGTMLVIRPISATNMVPTLGSTYTANLNWAGAGQIDVNNRVLFRASASSVTGLTGLTAETQYRATAYNYSASNCYQRDGAASATFWTLSTKPSTHSASFSVLAAGDSSVWLSFSAASTIANADGYILLQKAGSAPAGLPVNGTAYTEGSQVGDATVAAIISVASDDDYYIAGLTPSTLYYYELIPFNWNGTNPETYNYRTDATIPLLNTTTSSPLSRASDIITDPTFSYSSNINFVNYQSATATTVAGTVGVYKIIIRDGGGVADADAFPTIPEALFFGVNVKNAIRAVALYGGPNQDVYITSGVVGSTYVVFTGLSSLGSSVTAPDGESIELTLRVTFKSTITDNSQLQFSIDGYLSAAFPGGSSQFYKFPAEKSGMVGDNNRIEVIATKIKYDYQPDDRDAGVTLAPFAIVAVDIYDNIDLDKNSCNVTLTKLTGGGFMSAPGSPYTFVNGYVVVSDVSFSVATTGVSIRATAGTCLSSATATSNTFVITDVAYATGDYRSTGTVWGTLSHWQVRNSSGLWVAASVLPSSGSRAYINSAMSSSVTVTVTDIIILSGGALSVQAAAVMTTTNLVVKSGGSLLLANTVALTGNFIVEDGGTVTINFAATNQSSLWNGFEKFYGNSNFIIKNWGVSASPSSSRILYTDQITAYKNAIFFGKTGPQSPFGNLTIDLTTNLGNTLYLTDGSSGKGLTNGTLTVKSTNSAQRISYFGASTSGYSAVGGNLVVDATYASAGTFQISGSGSNNLEVFGDMNLNAASTVLKSNNGTSVDSISVYGNLNIAAATNLLFNELASTNDKVKLKLEGDLTVNATGNLGNFSGTSGVGNYELQFSGNGDGITSASTQEISIASTSTTAENVNIKFHALSGSFVRITNQDLELGQNSEMRVGSGATFDFGKTGSGSGLRVAISGAATNTAFFSEVNSILKITHFDGIWNSANPYGGVRTSNRTYEAGGTFWYIGSYSTQFVGNGLPSGSAAKTVIVELASNGNTLANFISTYFALRSGVEIRKGTLSESSGGGFYGQGYLTMATGTTYKSSNLNTVFPNLSDFDRYSITEGTFELSGASGTQTLDALPSSFQSLKISGSGTKTLSSNLDLKSGLLISGGNLDIGSYRIQGIGGLTMTNGTLKMGYSGAPIYPELEGAYSLTGGTVELYGSNASSTQKLRSSTISTPTISYSNLNINALDNNFTTHNVEVGGAFQVAGTMNINYPAVFYLSSSQIVSGAGIVNVNAKACLKLEEKNGLTPSSCGTGIGCGQIRTTTRNFSTDGKYWYVGNQSGAVTGLGLPASVNTLMVGRSGTSPVTLSSDVFVKYFIGVQSLGMLETGSQKIVLSDTALIFEEQAAHVIGKIESTRTLGLTNHTFGGMGLEIDADGSAPGSTLVSRHTGITITGAGNQAIKRKFSISPTVNTGLNATLVFKYFDDEINGLDENNFSLYRSTDAGVTWTTQGGTVDTDLNIVTKTGINAFSEWTLGDVNVPLPLSIISFTGKPDHKGKSFLEWKVANEKGVDAYRIMKSEDGNRFFEMSEVKAVNAKLPEVRYSIVDPAFNHSAYYTLYSVENGNQSSYKTIFVPCNCKEPLKFSAFPNPTSGEISLRANQSFAENSSFFLQLTGMDGRILFENKVASQQMESLLNAELKSATSGVYQIHLLGEEINQHIRIRKL